MRSNQKSPAWPYLAILLCLFVLSVTAPRAWQSVAHKQSLDGAIASRVPRFATTIAADTNPERSVEPLALDIVDEDLDVPIKMSPEPAIERESSDKLAQADCGPAPSVAPPATTAATNEIVETAEPPPQVAWTAPTTLFEQLDVLAHREACADWATRVAQHIHTLFEQADLDLEARREVLAKLHSLADAGTDLSRSLDDPSVEAELLRVQHGLGRRLDVWQNLPAWGATKSPEPTQTEKTQRAVAPSAIAACLANVKHLTGSVAEGAGWNDYLLLESLEKLAGTPSDQSIEERRQIARRVLDRLTRARTTRKRRQFIDVGPVAALAVELRHWATGPVDPADLLAHLEQYERSGLPSDAQALANDCRSLRWSTDPVDHRLAECIVRNYRNSNVRIALSKRFADRFVPQPPVAESPVLDTVVGVPVRGRSTTSTKTSLRFVPDEDQMRFGFEADGVVNSDTAAISGPATVYTNGESGFLVRKLIVCDQRGLRSWPATAEADNYYNNLVAVETNFDRFPLVGSIVRNAARTQHDELRGEARWEVEGKVAMRARDQLDREINPRVVAAAANFRRRVLTPIERLALDLEPIDMSTSENRAVGRLRLATEEQMGANTPRPRALSDSLCSVQVHQSALNNVLARLELEGHRYTLPELFDEIRQKLSRPKRTATDDLADDVIIKFADKDAISVRCDENRMEVTLAVAELVHGRNHWRNFCVRTSYRPEVDGLVPTLVRDGSIRLEGDSVKGKPQIVLRSIFSKVFSQDRHLNLTNDKWTHDPRVADLVISQFAIDHGWIGLAYAAPRPQHNVARKAK